MLAHDASHDATTVEALGSALRAAAGSRRRGLSPQGVLSSPEASQSAPASHAASHASSPRLGHFPRHQADQLRLAEFNERLHAASEETLDALASETSDRVAAVKHLRTALEEVGGAAAAARVAAQAESDARATAIGKLEATIGTDLRRLGTSLASRIDTRVEGATERIEVLEEGAARAAEAQELTDELAWKLSSAFEASNATILTLQEKSSSLSSSHDEVGVRVRELQERHGVGLATVMAEVDDMNVAARIWRGALLQTVDAKVQASFEQAIGDAERREGEASRRMDALAIQMEVAKKQAVEEARALAAAAIAEALEAQERAFDLKLSNHIARATSEFGRVMSEMLQEHRREVWGDERGEALLEAIDRVPTAPPPAASELSIPTPLAAVSSRTDTGLRRQAPPPASRAPPPFYPTCSPPPSGGGARNERGGVPASSRSAAAAMAMEGEDDGGAGHGACGHERNGTMESTSESMSPEMHPPRHSHHQPHHAYTYLQQTSYAPLSAGERFPVSSANETSADSAPLSMAADAPMNAHGAQHTREKRHAIQSHAQLHPTSPPSLAEVCAMLNRDLGLRHEGSLAQQVERACAVLGLGAMRDTLVERANACIRAVHGQHALAQPSPPPVYSWSADSAPSLAVKEPPEQEPPPPRSPSPNPPLNRSPPRATKSRVDSGLGNRAARPAARPPPWQDVWQDDAPAAGTRDRCGGGGGSGGRGGEAAGQLVVDKRNRMHIVYNRQAPKMRITPAQHRLVEHDDDDDDDGDGGGDDDDESMAGQGGVQVLTSDAGGASTK
jgi:plasmid maintenance system antidote protein VapI